jgi:hypothetical protein
VALHVDSGGRDVGLPFGQTRPSRSGFPDVRATVNARPRNAPRARHMSLATFRMEDEWIVRSSLKADEDSCGDCRSPCRGSNFCSSEELKYLPTAMHPRWGVDLRHCCGLYARS